MGRVVEQAASFFPEKRREPLDSPKVAALPHVPKQRLDLPRGKPPGVRSPQYLPLGRFGVFFAVEHEGRRGHPRRADLSRGFLGGGGELPDGVHAVFGKLQSRGKLRARGEQVDYRSPHAHLSPPLREVRLAVADPKKPLDDLVPLRLRSRLDGESLRLEIAGRRRSLEKRRGVRAENSRFLPSHERVDSLGFCDFLFLEKRAALLHPPGQQYRHPRSPDGGDGGRGAPALLPAFAYVKNPRPGNPGEHGHDEAFGFPAEAGQFDGTFAEGAEQVFYRGISRQVGKSERGSLFVQFSRTAKPPSQSLSSMREPISSVPTPVFPSSPMSAVR